MLTDVSTDHTIADALDARAERSPDVEVLRLAGGGLTVSAVVLAHASQQVAGGLARYVRRGDAVLTGVSAGIEAVEVTIALARLGAVEVPVTGHISDAWMGSLVTAVKPVATIVSGEMRAQWSPVIQRLIHQTGPIVMIGMDNEPLGHAIGLEELVASPSRIRGSRTVGRDPALIISTSGTTGLPKGAMLRHSVGMGQALRVARAMKYGSGDAIYSFFPWQYINARHAAFLAALVSDARVVIGSKFSASNFWNICRSDGVTAFNFVGAVCAILLQASPSALDSQHLVRKAYGGPAPRVMTERFRARFGVDLLQAYACTELGDVCTSSPDDFDDGAAGRPVPEYDVRIVGGPGRSSAIGEIGNIEVRPKYDGLTFDAYVGAPAATAAAWRNGWYQTTDRGHFDRNGRLWFDGRSVDVIRRRGLNISAVEVESVILAHADVVSAVVVGVRSELTDEELLAVVVLSETSDESPADIWASCAAQLPRHAVPRFISIEKTLALTTNMKVSREELRKRGIPQGVWEAQEYRD